MHLLSFIFHCYLQKRRRAQTLFSINTKLYLFLAERIISMERQQPRVVKTFNRELGQHSIHVNLYEQELRIQIRSNGFKDSYHFTNINNDNFPKELSILFQNYSQLYEFLNQTNDNFQLETPSQLTLLIPIRNRTSRIPIYLSQKKLTQQELIQSMRTEITRLQSIQNQYNLIIRTQSVADMIAREKESFQLQKATLKNQIVQMQKQIDFLKNKNELLQNQLNSQQIIIEQLNQQSLNHSNLLKDITGQTSMMQERIPIINPQGELLFFRPQPKDINFSLFQFKDNVLTKNRLLISGQPRMIQSASPIPRYGRFFYKLQLKFHKDPPQFVIGISGYDLKSTVSILKGYNAVISYFCKYLGREVIFEGQNRVQGYNLSKNSVMIIVVDRDRNQVEWHIQGIHFMTSKFSEQMKASPNLYMFIQLWNAGDEIIMLNF